MAKTSSSKGLSEKNKRLIIIIAAAVLVVGGGWYAYDTLTVIPPPKLDAPGVQPQQVAEYLGARQGFPRMTVDQREQYMMQINKTYQQPEARERFVEALGRLSPSEKQVLLDASFEVAKTRVVERAREYNKQSSPAKRKAFVDNVIREAESMRRNLGGGAAGPSQNVGEPFKEAMPTSTDELMKVMVDRTTAQDRSEARDFVEHYTTRQKELKNNPTERKRFDDLSKLMPQ